MSRQAIIGNLHGHRIKSGGGANKLVWLAIDNLERSVQPAAAGCLLCRWNTVPRSATAIVRLRVIDQSAEVAAQHLRSGCCGRIARGPRSADYCRSLVVEEEEELVLDGRSADVAAVLVAPESILYVVAPIRRVKISVAHEFK